MKTRRGWRLCQLPRIPRVREDAPIVRASLRGRDMWSFVWIHESWLQP